VNFAVLDLLLHALPCNGDLLCCHKLRSFLSNTENISTQTGFSYLQPQIALEEQSSSSEFHRISAQLNVQIRKHMHSYWHWTCFTCNISTSHLLGAANFPAENLAKNVSKFDIQRRELIC